MDNATRKFLLQRHKQSGFPGSILDVFQAYNQGIDIIGQFEQQQNIQVARTPQQQQQGLRPAHQAGNVSQSMIFPNVPPNTPFTTVGMKAPINIEKYDEQGHLVKSYENVPPGIANLPMGPQRGTVIETPANMQSGGFLLSTLGNPAFTGPLMMRGVMEEGKRRIANNLFPSGYTSESQNKLPEQRLYDAVVLNQPEPSSRAALGPRPENPSRRYLSLEERGNLLGYAMGQHNNLPSADYRPTDAQDSDAVYFKSPTTEQNLIEKLESEEDALKWINRHTANGDGGIAYHTGVDLNVLGNYTLDKGQDDKGHYISYYDIWDLDPFKDKTGKAVSDAVQSLAGVRSPEIYGRIYYDPETGKPTTKKKQAGGDYNMARAKELGYKPDATGHYPSVDHETGMLLKSKKHPTVKLEFMSQMLSPERKLIANPTGYFGENQLQYVPRKFQSAGFTDRNYLPPIAQQIERAGGFDAYQDQLDTAQAARELFGRPTISQGNFDVDEEGMIVEDNPSFLEMAANPMATAKTILDPSVKGLPSQVEFDKAKNKGTLAGQAANDLVNPFAWMNYGTTAVGNLARGEFADAGLNALGAIPGIGVGGLGVQAARRAGITGLSNLYKANPYLKNPMGFRNIGDKPHFLFGYNKKIDPMRMDLSPEAGFQQFLGERDLLHRALLQGRMSSATMLEKEAELFAKTPFSESLGSGSFGSVHHIGNNRDYVLKMGKGSIGRLGPDLQKGRYAGITDDFIARTSQLAHLDNVAVPLRSSTIPLSKFNRPRYSYQKTMPDGSVRNVSVQPKVPQTELTVMKAVDGSADVGGTARAVREGRARLPNRDQFAAALKKVRQMRDKGIAIDIDNPANIKFNRHTGDFNLYDLENVPQLAARNAAEFKALQQVHGPMHPNIKEFDILSPSIKADVPYSNPSDYMFQVRGLMGMQGSGIPNKAGLRLLDNFKKGGFKRKYQSGNYLATAESTSRPMSNAERAFLNPPAERLQLPATISQGNFDVDEEGNIIEDQASVLDMMANPMATLRTVVDPSVEGLPTEAELQKAKSKGNVAGQIANDIVNPAAWLNYGVGAVRNLGNAASAAYQGEGVQALDYLGQAGLDALGAVPGIPGAKAITQKGLKYGRKPYLLNKNRTNKYDFHSVGDKPHFWRGYEKPITDPSKLSPSSNFAGYLDDLKTTETMAKKPVWEQGARESRALFGRYPKGQAANEFSHKVFGRMDVAAGNARTAFNQRYAPFLGDEIGRGAYGRVYKFKNNPDYVFKIGRSEGANAKPAFRRALSQFENRSNIATPLQKSNFPLTDRHFGIRQGTGEALVMRNLNSPTFATQRFAGLNARQARALEIKTARQLRDAGIGLDFAADAGNIASSRVSPNMRNFFDLHYKPGLQHDSRYLANQYLRK